METLRDGINIPEIQLGARWFKASCVHSLLRSHHCLNNLFLPFFLLESRSHPHTVNGLREEIGGWEERHTYEHIHVRLARLYYATYVLKAQRARCKT